MKKIIFPINQDSKLRTKDNFETLSDLAIEGKSSKGVLGKTLLSEVIDFPNKIMIDYMHLIFEGECKFLCSKWFDSRNNRKKYYIGNIKTCIYNIFF